LAHAVSFIVVAAEHRDITKASRLTTLHKTVHALRNPVHLLRRGIESLPVDAAVRLFPLLMLVWCCKTRGQVPRPGVIVTPEHSICSQLERWQCSI
jgi:hypothetical protein